MPEHEYGTIVDAAIRSVRRDHHALFTPLSERMNTLAAQERFEEATAVRERLSALAGALERQRRFDSLLGCERLLLEVVETGEVLELRRGVLWQTFRRPEAGREMHSGHRNLWGDPLDDCNARQVEMQPEALPCPSSAVSKGLADELSAVASWLDANASAVRLQWVDGELSSRLPQVPRFTPRRPRAPKRLG
jgi:excinuclease UvrABC nuclease subunit